MGIRHDTSPASKLQPFLLDPSRRGSKTSVILLFPLTFTYPSREHWWRFIWIWFPWVILSPCPFMTVRCQTAFANDLDLVLDLRIKDLRNSNLQIYDLFPQSV